MQITELSDMKNCYKYTLKDSTLCMQCMGLRNYLALAQASMFCHL